MRRARTALAAELSLSLSLSGTPRPYLGNLHSISIIPCSLTHTLSPILSHPFTLSSCSRSRLLYALPSSSSLSRVAVLILSFASTGPQSCCLSWKRARFSFFICQPMDDRLCLSVSTSGVFLFLVLSLLLFLSPSPSPSASASLCISPFHCFHPQDVWRSRPVQTHVQTRPTALGL